MDRNQLAKLIDHTLLKPEATDADVVALCVEAAELGTFSVCVSPTFVSLAVANVSNGVKVATVCGFPSGKHEAEIKAAEAKLPGTPGAQEVDQVSDVRRATLWDLDYFGATGASILQALG